MTRPAGCFFREFPLEVRAASDDPENRTYDFVIATESPVDVGIGRPEVLRMRGIDWTRMRPSFSVLDTHSRSGISSILGKATAKVVGRELHARFELDKSPEGDAAKIRLDSGSLRTASIGYRVFRDKARELREGEWDGKGEARVEGPALVQGGWQPYEMTLCSVPADERAVRLRSFGAKSKNTTTGSSRKESRMAKGTRLNYSDLPTAGDDDEGQVEGELDHENGEGERAEKPAKKPTRSPAPVTPIRAEIAERERAVVDRRIRSITPKGLEAVAEECVLDELDLDEARERLKKALAKRSKPNGTPDPKDEPAEDETPAENKAAEALTPEAVERTLKGLRS